VADSKGNVLSANVPLDQFIAAVAADVERANELLQQAFPEKKLVFQTVTVQPSIKGEIDGHTGDLQRLLTGAGAEGTPVTVTFSIVPRGEL
jgi:hypothetical protein